MNMWMLVDSPIGSLRIVGDGEAVTAIEFEPHGEIGGERCDDDPVLVEAGRQLTSYFAGERTDFDLALAPDGTPFQLKVWQALRTIGYGETASYGDIARQLGMRPGAARAVGLANGANPIPIVVPCHRVIGADGSLTGYGGGIDRKRALLELEQPALF